MPSADEQCKEHEESQQKTAENLLANDFHAKCFTEIARPAALH